MLVDSTCITGAETATTAPAVEVILVKDEVENTIHTKEGGGGAAFADTSVSKISTATRSEQGQVLGASDPDITKENQQQQKEEEKMEGSNSTEPQENDIQVQQQKDASSTQSSTSVVSASEPFDNSPVVAGEEEKMDGSDSAAAQDSDMIVVQQQESSSAQPSTSVDSTEEPQEIIPCRANNDAADIHQQNQGKMEGSDAAEPQETNAVVQQQDESSSVQPSASADSTAEPQEVIPSTANNDAADYQQQNQGKVRGSDSADPQDLDILVLQLSSVQPSVSVDSTGSTAEPQEIITCTANNDAADNQHSEEGGMDGSDSAELHDSDTVVQQQQQESSSAQSSTLVHSTAEPQEIIPATANNDAATNQQKEQGEMKGSDSAEAQESNTVVQQQEELSTLQPSASVDSTAEPQGIIPSTVTNDAADNQQEEEGKMEGSDTAEPEDSDALAQQGQSSTAHSAAPEICMADPQADNSSKPKKNAAGNQQKEEVKIEGSDSEPQDSDVLVQQQGASSSAHSTAPGISAVEPQADSPSAANNDTEDKKQQKQEEKMEGSDSAGNSGVLVQQQQESNSAQSTTSEVSAASTSEASETEAHDNWSSSTTRDAATTATAKTNISFSSDRHENAPFHDLMIKSPGQHSEAQLSLLEPMHMLLTDHKLRRDYLSRRFRAHRGTKRKQQQCTEKANISTTTGRTKNNSTKEEDEATTTCVANGNPITNTGRNSKYQRTRHSGNNSSNGYADSLWSGATALEIALIDCCELPPIEEDDNPSAVKIATMETTTMTISGEEAEGGSLARGYELQFANLVAKHCHTFSSRVLALAILERTLQQDIREALEEEEAKNGDSNSQSMEEKDSGQKEEQIGEHEQEKDQADGNSDEEDDDYDPNERTTRSKRKSKRIQKRKRGRPPKRAKTSSKDKVTKPAAPPTQSDTRLDAGSTNASKGEADKKPHQPDRMTVFFAAGGLKILRGWLMEAMTPVVTFVPAEEDGLPDTENSPASKDASTPSKKYKPSQYGPMLLPLLVLLSKIPFDKTLIVESKINKQIRRLSKQVDGLIDAFKKKCMAKLDLETFVDPEAGAGGCLVIRVQEILNKLKEIWEEHAKKDLSKQQQQPKIADPYNGIKTKLRERLGDLKGVAAGKIEKPEWLTRCEGLQQEQLKKRPRKNVISRPVEKANTQQLALKEREAERAALQDKLKAAQEERKAHLERLKVQINKRIQGAKLDAPTKRKKSSKTVKWKDGLSTDKIRKRDLLEVVHVVEYETEHTTTSLPEKSGKREEEVPPPEQDESATEDIMDEDGLFDFDETLLL